MAAISPSHVVFQASNITLKRNSSWAYKGEELPFVSFPRFSIATVKGVLSGENYLDMHQQALRNKKAVDAARIKVEKIKGSVLLLSAKHDHMWPSAAMAKEVVQRLKANQFPYHYEHVEWNSDHYILDDPNAWYRVLDFTESQLGKSVKCDG